MLLNKYHNNSIGGIIIYTIQPATPRDIDALEALYNALHHHLQTATNYANWKKGVYPIRETAANAVANGTMYALREGTEIKACVILNHHQEPPYKTVQWDIDCPDDQILVIHTLVVHPDCAGRGMGKAFLDFAAQTARQTGMKAIRLDTAKGNLPAATLYEKSGYVLHGIVDLGTEENPSWCRLYELVL